VRKSCTISKDKLSIDCFEVLVGRIILSGIEHVNTGGGDLQSNPDYVTY